jgi:Protein of unknown function (DUF2927)
MRALLFAVITGLTACSATQQADVSKQGPFDETSLSSQPAIRSFPPTAAASPTRSNTDIAADFLDLEFHLESGRALSRLTRFEGPITVALTGDVPPTAQVDLARLLVRLRAEAGIDISAISERNASIMIDFLPRARMQAVVPTAACFVAPRVASWADYRKQRGRDYLDWVTLTRRERIAIFVPSDTSPQEVRDCLHEEMAQAIGPLNDLYRLPDSVFNDDNFHTVLTGFDMLILRLHYSSELRNGMTEPQVAALLPDLLARFNPRGGTDSTSPSDIGPRQWVDAIEAALGPTTRNPRRIKAAEQALAIARSEGWQDNRLAFSHFAVGRLSLGKDVARAVVSFAEAARIYASLPDGPVHTAHVDMQMAAFALSSGQPEVTIALADQAIPVVTRAENAALLATFMLLKAQALDQQGHTDEARALRLDSLGWARYGFGSDDQVRARMNDIAALSPMELGG